MSPQSVMRPRAPQGGTTRLSFGPFLSKQDVKFATDALAQIAPRAASSSILSHR